MRDYLDEIEFPFREIEDARVRKRTAAAQREMGAVYSDDRNVRSDAERAEDANVVPSAVGKHVEWLVKRALRQDNSPLSTQLSINRPGQPTLACYVHRELDSLVYESMPRRAFLQRVEEVSAVGAAVCTVRTFFPPLSASQACPNAVL